MRQLTILLLSVMTLGGCAVENELNDGLWEIRARVSAAELTIDEQGHGEVDFTFVYLLGLVDGEGIEDVEWSYALVDSDANELAKESQVMRQAQADRTEVFVQGDRPRVLAIEETILSSDETYVLWIKVFYRDATLTEVLVPVSQGEAYVNELPTGDIPQFSTR